MEIAKCPPILFQSRERGQFIERGTSKRSPVWSGTQLIGTLFERRIGRSFVA